MESLVCLAWSLVFGRFCGQDSVTFGAALPPFTKAVPVHMGAASRPVATAAKEAHELLTQIRASLPAWGALLPGDPGAAYSLPALFGYDLPEDHVWAEELSGGAWPLAVTAAERGETVLISAWAQIPGDPSTVCAYMRTALERLAGTLEAAPDAPAASIDVMPEEERRNLLAKCRATGTACRHDRCIHELFEEQAAKTPDVVAVVHGGSTLTYSQLNARANRLAYHLRALGVRPDERVAICVERSLEMLIGLLAILKAGGAYVPIDPVYPVDRMAHMLADSAPVAALVGGSTRAALDRAMAGIPARPPVIDLEDAWTDQSSANPGRAEIGLTSSHVAYVIYTSGSTGQPKGVMIEHRNVVRLFTATEDWFQFDEKDVWTLFHSFAFDFSVWEIWGALLYGGRLIVVPQLTTRSPQDFYALLVEQQVTVLNQTPSAFAQLMAAQSDSIGAHSLRYVIFGGEALDASTLKPWYKDQRNGHARLINMYGITETTVHVTYYLLEPADADKPRASRIGGPIPDLSFYILDDHGEPAPVGVAGEIYVGGAGVARGYLNRSELTAARFVPSRFVEGDRLYKTGDLARYLPDGNIEHLGRNDFQVKIRGFRIELGEIEARLAEYEGVSEVNVIAREDSPGEKRLVAYYVAGTPIRPEELRAHLAPSLPEYMVPAAYVRLDLMPLTFNGKLDRRALPAPDSSAYVQDAYEAPAGPVEEKLARIWAAVLGLDRISRNANFFDLGGHSLLAIRMLTLIEAEFDRSLDLTSLFRAPSIAVLGQLLREGGGPSVSSPYVVPVQPEGTKPPLFAIMSPTMYRDIAKYLGNTQPVMGLQLFNPAIRFESKYSCLEDVANECVQLILETQPQGPYAVIGWCVGGVVAFETAQQLVQMGHEVSFVGIIDGWAPDYVRRRGAAWLKTVELIALCKRAYTEIRTGRRGVTSLVTEALARLRRVPRADVNAISADPELKMIEHLNWEAFRYLWKLQGTYEPKPFHGRLHVFVSEYRPTGWLADPGLGWGRLTTKGVEAATFEGEHRAFFDEPGAAHAAALIAAGLQPPSARNALKAPSASAAVRPNGQSTPANPLVSIVIPAYNAEKDIARVIRCAISQTYPEIEIIVADDGSQDGTVHTAREILKSSFEGRWSVLELGVNRGPSAARNVAVKQAKGEWIQFLDSDDAIAADKIETQMNYARNAAPGVPAIYSSWRHVYLEDGDFIPAGPVNTPRYEGKHPVMFCMFYAGLHHGACLIRRSALERVQGFNETLRNYEDADLLVRLTKEIGQFQFAASKSPSYLWRIYKEQAREGGENTRYKLQDTAMNWVRVVKEAAGNHQIDEILSCPDDAIVWAQHCTSYARRLVESDAGAFKPFMDELRSIDADFTYPRQPVEEVIQGAR
jgi:amino acid adenylation domain-containing protein